MRPKGTPIESSRSSRGPVLISNEASIIIFYPNNARAFAAQVQFSNMNGSAQYARATALSIMQA
jgi:hypothetical protein